MPEIGTSGLMSGERKRDVAARPKSPRLSSTLRAPSGLRVGAPNTHHAVVMLQITRDAFISGALSLEPGRFA
jgi:hypothetical protein